MIEMVAVNLDSKLHHFEDFSVKVVLSINLPDQHTRYIFGHIFTGTRMRNEQTPSIRGSQGFHRVL
jgi:hypothetical protein